MPLSEPLNSRQVSKINDLHTSGRGLRRSPARNAIDRDNRAALSSLTSQLLLFFQDLCAVERGIGLGASRVLDLDVMATDSTINDPKPSRHSGARVRRTLTTIEVVQKVLTAHPCYLRSRPERLSA